MVEESLLPMDKSCVDMRHFFLRNGNKKVDVPLEFWRRTYQTERETNFRAWKLKTGCDVLAYGDKRNNTITRFEVFGTGVKAEQAVSEVKDWICTASTKTPASTAWAKVKAYDPVKYGFDTLRDLDVQRREMFKGPVPEGTQDLYKVSG